MELQESGDHRCHMAEYGVPTIQLGCGGTTVSTINLDGEMTGIGFSLGDGYVGEYKPDVRGKSVTEIDTFFQILTSNAGSIQVLIDRLTEARDILENQEE